MNVWADKTGFRGAARPAVFTTVKIPGSLLVENQPLESSSGKCHWVLCSGNTTAMVKVVVKVGRVIMQGTNFHKV